MDKRGEDCIQTLWEETKSQDNLYYLYLRKALKILEINWTFEDLETS